MRRKFAVLGLPVAAVAVAGVMSLGQLGATPAPTMTAPAGSNNGQVIAADVNAGAGVALTMTNWEETGAPSSTKGTPTTTR